ncbi:hypothetical protein GC163_02400 [bacterium]|nr:hypothetical protein [bacterium]
MSEWMPLAADWWQKLALFLSVGLPGLPTGSVDPQQLTIIPQEAMIAVSWDGRGPGTLNGQGFDGAIADPEIQRAIAALQTGLAQTSEEGAASATDHIAAVWQQISHYPGCGYVAFQPATQQSPPRWEAAIVISPGPDGPALLEQLRPHAPAWLLVDANAPGPKPFTTGLVKFQQIDSRLIWSVGDAWPRIAQRLATGAGGLATQSDFQGLSAALHAESAAARVWIRLPEVLPPAVGVSAPVREFVAPFTSWSALLSLQSEQGHVVARAALKCPPAILAQRGPAATIPPKTWTRIPADALYVAAMECDLETVLQTATAIVERQLPPGHQAGSLLRRLETELGIDIARDVAPSFGDTWVVSSSPSTGGALGLGPVFSLSVTYPQQAETTFMHVMKRLQSVMADDADATTWLKSERVEGRTVYCLQSTESPWHHVAPCFCLTEHELLVTLQPQTMRAHLRFLSESRPNFAERDDLARKISGASTAEFYLDGRALTSVLWPMVPFVIGQQLNQPELRQLGIDASLWPSTSAMVRYSAPTTARLQQTDFGWIVECKNPLSLAPPLIAAAALLTPPAPAMTPDSIKPELGQPMELTIDLGTAEGQPSPTPDTQVVPAVAETPNPPAPRNAWRSWVPGLIRAVTPDDVEMLIPNEAFESIEAGPSEERLQRRQARRNARRGIAEPATPTPIPAPTPNP